jgi:hypothetical protein
MREERGPWYLLTGLVIGVIIGLVYAWRVAPVKYVDTSPATMRQDFKDQYRALIASAFAADNDLARAQARLDLLKDPDSAQSVAIQAQQALAGGKSPAEAHALGLLAVALSNIASPSQSTGSSPVPTTPVPIPSATPLPATATPSPTKSPASPSPGTAISVTVTATVAAFTLPPSLTPTPTSGAPFVLSGDAKQVCDATLKQPLIMVEAKDAAGQPVPGVEILVNWPGNQDHFFTGLKPEHGPGYGDYVMTPDVTYTIHVADGGQQVPGLKASTCTATGGSQFLGSWSLVFVQP